MSRQPTNKVLILEKEKKKTTTLQGDADDSERASQGQVADKEKVGVEQQEAGRVSKDQTTFTTSFMSPEQK